MKRAGKWPGHLILIQRSLHHWLQRERSGMNQAAEPSSAASVSSDGSRVRASKDASTVRSADTAPTRSYIRESVGRPKLTMIPPWANLHEVAWSPKEHQDRSPKVSVTSDINGSAAAASQAKSGDLNILPDSSSSSQSVSSPSSSTQPLPPAKSQDYRRNHNVAPDEGWWTFTLPAKARQKLDEYWAANSGGADSHKVDDPEKQMPEFNEKASKGQGGIGGPADFSNAMLRSRGPGYTGEWSANQAQTPGWSTPWTPFRRQSWNPWDRHDENRPVEGPDDPRLHKLSFSDRRHTWISRFQHFLLTSPFAPFWLRFCNLAFACCTLALAARIEVVEKRADEEGIIGSSTIIALVIAPLSIIHIAFALWFEYFGAPIGVWSVRTKMLHTYVLKFFSRLVALF